MLCVIILFLVSSIGSLQIVINGIVAQSFQYSDLSILSKLFV